MTTSMRPSLTDLIGALEIGAGLQFNLAADDTKLEAAAELSAGPTQMGGPGCMTHVPMCRHIDDGALEQTAALSGPPTHSLGCPTGPLACRHIDDGALEASVAGPQPTRVGWPGCLHIDDEALKAASVTAGPTQTRYPPCRFISDIELEAAVAGPQPTRFGWPGCMHIDDGALEASVAGPQNTHFPYCPHHIDEGHIGEGDRA